MLEHCWEAFRLVWFPRVVQEPGALVLTTGVALPALVSVLLPKQAFILTGAV